MFPFLHLNFSFSWLHLLELKFTLKTLMHRKITDVICGIVNRNNREETRNLRIKYHFM